MGRLTKLDAVNRILAAASEQPVQSLTVTPTNESLLAESVLDEVNLREQAQGMDCNVKIDVFSPDVNGEIILPDTTLYVEPWYNEYGRDVDMPDSRWREVTVRGAPSGTGIKLFDLRETTTVFDDDVTLKVVLLLDFEELPLLQQFRVTDMAARLYEMREQGDPAVGALLEREAQFSRAMGRAHEWRSRRLNLFRTSQSYLARLLRRVRRPYTGWYW